jgi:hypothetical protein
MDAIISRDILLTLVYDGKNQTYYYLIYGLYKIKYWVNRISNFRQLIKIEWKKVYLSFENVTEKQKY